MLAVKASATSTQISIDLLRQHLKVARLHDQLLSHSRQRLGSHLQRLSPSRLGAGDDAAELEAAPAAVPQQAQRRLRPWPEPAASRLDPGRRSSVPPSLAGGLREAGPVLGRLFGQLDDAMRIR